MKSTRYESIRSMPCPNCSEAIRYYHFGSMGDVAPHFYCSRCSNVYFRQSDHNLIRAEPPSEPLLNRIAAALPVCPCGGRFAPGENPKCPHCGSAIPHQLDPVQRLTDPYAVLVEGAVLVTEDE